MKRIVIPGIGNVQADLIRICKEYGYSVFSCANSERGPGRELSDGFELIDIADTKGVLRYAERVGADLVYTVGSDIAMPTVCRVSEELGLPCFISSGTAVTCNSKHLMRSRLGEDFPWNLGFQIIDSAEDVLPLPFPLMMKPADSQGQRGVRLVNCPGEVERYFGESMSFSRCRKVILEEYADGPEIGVSFYMVGGEMVFFAAFDCMVWDQIPGKTIGRGAVTPSKIVSENPGPVKDLIRSAAERLGITDGPAFSQIRYRGRVPKLLEITPRLDGGHLWRLWMISMGVNILRLTVDHFSGRIPSGQLFRPAGKPEPAALEHLCCAPGTEMNRGRFNVTDCDHVEWYYSDGEPVRPINGIMEKSGSVFRKLSADEWEQYSFPYGDAADSLSFREDDVK